MSDLAWVRLGFSLLCVGALVLGVLQRVRVLAALRTFLFAPTPPLNLALLRIFIFGIICYDACLTRADFVATLSPEFLKLRWGWFWLRDVLVMALPWTGAAKALLIVAAACAALGFLTRVSSILAALLAVYVFGIANFYFRLMHNLHVEVLCAILLSASPAGDAISMDALTRRARGRVLDVLPSAAYTFPIRAAWLLLGLSYLFPGLIKLWDSGDLWLQGIKPHVDILQKWTEFPDRLPPIDVDRFPFLLPIQGTSTLFFEIGFTFALFNRTSRLFAGLMAVGFHLGIMLFMNIWFSPFLPLMVLCDFPQLLAVRPFGAVLGPVSNLFGSLARRIGDRGRRLAPASKHATLERSPRLPLVVGSVLLGAMLLAGVADTLSWPIARFPTFSRRATALPETTIGLAFKVRKADGREIELPDAIAPLGSDGVVGHNVIREIRKIQARNQSAAASEQAFRPWARMLAQTVRESSGPFAHGDRLVIYTFKFSVVPAKRVRDQRKLSRFAEVDL